jgi:hypothetical protein
VGGDVVVSISWLDSLFAALAIIWAVAGILGLGLAVFAIVTWLKEREKEDMYFTAGGVKRDLTQIKEKLGIRERVRENDDEDAK